MSRYISIPLIGPTITQVESLTEATNPSLFARVLSYLITDAARRGDLTYKRPFSTEELKIVLKHIGCYDAEVSQHRGISQRLGALNTWYRRAIYTEETRMYKIEKTRSLVEDLKQEQELVSKKLKDAQEELTELESSLF